MFEGKGKTILLVEDETLIALAEKALLEEYGYEVRLAPSGETAVAAADDSAVDLVLMDINLGPGIDGAEAAKRILEKREMPVVFLSSHTESEIVAKTEAIGSYGYVVKNSGETVLLASLKMAFRLFEAKTKEREKNRALEHSYELLQYLIEYNQTSIAVFDRDMRYLYVSQRFLEDYLIKGSQVIGKNHYEVFPEIPERWREVHRRALAGEGASAEDDPLVRKDGTVDYVRWDCRPWYDADGKVGGIVLYSEVSTRRKKAEDAAKANEEVFRKAFLLSPISISINRLSDGVYVNTNEAFFHLTGFTGEDVQGKTSADLGIWQDSAARGEFYRKIRSVGMVCNYESRFRKKDGSTFTGLISASVIELDGAPHLLSLCRDIDEIKRSQEELAKQEAVHRTMIANITDVIAVMDSSGIVRYKSHEPHQALRLAARGPRGKAGLGYDAPRRSRADQGRILQAFGTPEGDDHARISVSPQGRGLSAHQADCGEPVARSPYPGRAHELPRYNAAQSRGNRSQGKRSQVPFARGQLHGRDLDLGRGGTFYLCESLGREAPGLYPRRGPQSETADEVLTPESRERMRTALMKTLATIAGGKPSFEPSVIELEQPRKDGTAVWTEASVRALFDAEKRLTGFLGVTRDISERRREEKAIQDALRKLRFHLENTPLAVIEFDRGYKINSWSKKAEEIFGWKAEEVVGKRIGDFRWVYEEDTNKVGELSSRMLNEEIFSTVNVNRNYRKDGTIITCQWYNSVLQGDTEDEYSVLSLVLDITEQLRAEERARNLLREKEIILKEVHHRVKNNMLIVMNLLKLDASAKTNQEAKSILTDAASRVQSMQVLYDKLYRSESGSSASAAQYVSALIRENRRPFPEKGFGAHRYPDRGCHADRQGAFSPRDQSSTNSSPTR